jgi:hypothetical protein
LWSCNLRGGGGDDDDDDNNNNNNIVTNNSEGLDQLLPGHPSAMELQITIMSNAFIIRKVMG